MEGKKVEENDKYRKNASADDVRPAGGEDASKEVTIEVDIDALRDGNSQGANR